MENISPEQDVEALLAVHRSGQPWPDRELFRVVERLADLFEPRLCDLYARLFAEVIESVIPGQNAAQIVERYQRIRQPRKFDRDASSIRKVFVLSRVTLGADVAVTSIVLNAAKQLFENAVIYFVGPQKSWELFDADPALEHVPVQYHRSGTLAGRLGVWQELSAALDFSDSIVIDPDSRLTQLGLLPIGPDEDYYFFESRSYGGDSAASLPDLTSRWVEQTFGVYGATPYIATLAATGDPVGVTVSLGVGENPSKRVIDPFEADLLRLLVDRSSSILVDRGAGGEEAERVERAAAQSGGRIRLWDGSFAGFAAQIAASSLYVGYDSAGGHVAAASGVPMISIFGGYPCERMFQRWSPTGSGPITVIQASDSSSTLNKVIRALGPRAGSQEDPV